MMRLVPGELAACEDLQIPALTARARVWAGMREFDPDDLDG